MHRTDVGGDVAGVALVQCESLLPRVELDIHRPVVTDRRGRVDGYGTRDTVRSVNASYLSLSVSLL